MRAYGGYVADGFLSGHGERNKPHSKVKWQVLFDISIFTFSRKNYSLTLFVFSCNILYHISNAIIYVDDRSQMRLFDLLDYINKKKKGYRKYFILF